MYKNNRFSRKEVCVVCEENLVFAFKNHRCFLCWYYDCDLPHDLILKSNHTKDVILNAEKRTIWESQSIKSLKKIMFIENHKRKIRDENLKEEEELKENKLDHDDIENKINNKIKNKKRKVSPYKMDKHEIILKELEDQMTIEEIETIPNYHSNFIQPKPSNKQTKSQNPLDISNKSGKFEKNSMIYTMDHVAQDLYKIERMKFGIDFPSHLLKQNGEREERERRALEEAEKVKGQEAQLKKQRIENNPFHPMNIINGIINSAISRDDSKRNSSRRRSSSFYKNCLRF